MNGTTCNKAQLWAAYLRAARPGKWSLVDEYVELIERHCGEGYWNNLVTTNVQDLLDDFDMYCKYRASLPVVMVVEVEVLLVIVNRG